MEERLATRVISALIALVVKAICTFMSTAGPAAAAARVTSAPAPAAASAVEHPFDEGRVMLGAGPIPSCRDEGCGSMHA